jgi:hypothetical protein
MFCDLTLALPPKDCTSTEILHFNGRISAPQSKTTAPRPKKRCTSTEEILHIDRKIWPEVSTFKELPRHSILLNRSSSYSHHQQHAPTDLREPPETVLLPDFNQHELFNTPRPQPLGGQRGCEAEA